MQNTCNNCGAVTASFNVFCYKCGTKCVDTNTTYLQKTTANTTSNKISPSNAAASDGDLINTANKKEVLQKASEKQQQEAFNNKEQSNSLKRAEQIVRGTYTTNNIDTKQHTDKQHVANSINSTTTNANQPQQYNNNFYNPYSNPYTQLLPYKKPSPQNSTQILLAIINIILGLASIIGLVLAIFSLVLAKNSVKDNILNKKKLRASLILNIFALIINILGLVIFTFLMIYFFSPLFASPWVYF